MSIEHPNPYSSPTPVVYAKSFESRAVVLAFGVCTLFLTTGMLAAQLIARSHLASYGVELPVGTHMAMNPLFACLPLIGLAFVLASQSWESNWRRWLVWALSILFAFCCVVYFGLAIYLPIEAMLNSQTAPLFILENYLQRKLCALRYLSQGQDRGIDDLS